MRYNRSAFFCCDYKSKSGENMYVHSCEMFDKITYLPLPLFLPKNFALRTYRVLERIDRSLIGYDNIDGIVIG